MPLTYPLALPDVLRPRDIDFRIEWNVSQRRSRSGVAQSVDWADPFWKMMITSPAHDDQVQAEITAWWDALYGGTKTFLAHDLGRAHPGAYDAIERVLDMRRATGAAFNGSVAVPTVTATTITLGVAAGSCLPAHMMFLPGDYVGLVRNTSTISRGLFRILEAVDASSAGVAVVTVAPQVPLNVFTGSLTADVVKASAEFVPDIDSFSGGFSLSKPGVSFAAYSVIRA